MLHEHEKNIYIVRNRGGNVSVFDRVPFIGRVIKHCLNGADPILNKLLILTNQLDV